MSQHIILELEDLEDLDRASVLASWLNRPSVEAVRVTLPWLGGDERLRAAEELHRQFNDCGCFWGGPAFLLVLGGSIAMRTSEGESPWSATGMALVAAVPAAVAAKLLGLAVSRWRLMACLRDLRRQGELTAVGASSGEV